MFKVGQDVYLLIRAGSSAAKNIIDRADPKQWIIESKITNITKRSVVVGGSTYFDRYDSEDLHNNEYNLYTSEDLAISEAKRRIIVRRLDSIMRDRLWTNNYTVEELSQILFTLEHGVPSDTADSVSADQSTFFK